MPFWQFFRQGRDGRALLVRPSRIPRWISKIIFALGSYEFLAMLEGKTRKVQSGKIKVWGHFFLIWLLKYLRKNSIPNKHVSLTQTQINKCQFSQQTLKPYWDFILLWSRLLQFFLFWVYLLSNVTSTGATNVKLWNPNFEFSVSIAIELLTTWFH